MKKRWIAWLLAVTMCLSLLPVSVLAADGEEINEPETEEVAPVSEQETPEEVHTHSYEAVVTEPTETEQGYTTYTCSCGDSYVTDYTEPLGTVTEEPAPEGTPEITEETPEITEEAVAAEVPPLMLTAGTDEGIYKDSGDGWTLTYDGVLTIYYNGDAQLDFPDRLEDRRSEITALVIEEGFEYLGDWGFHDCGALQSVSLPQSLRHMNSGFTGCTNLREITIPSGVEYICVGAFYGCTSLESVVLPSSLEAINSNTFEDCTALKSITLPESLMYIEEGAFSGCTSLTSVTFPKNLRPINERAFEGCSSLTAFALESGSEYCSVVDGILYDDDMYELVCCPPGKSGTVTVPESVKKIDPFAFVSCTKLTEVVLPSGLKEIPYHAFYGCSGLTGVTVPSGVKTIGDDAFSGCSSLTGVSLPAGVTSIGYCAFEGCSSLVSFTVPAACTNFGSDVFYGCSSLASVTFPSGLTSIGSAFVDCVSLMDAVIPEGVTEISGTFQGCTNLTTVTIPASVTVFGYNLFKNCTALTTVYYGGTEAQWAAIDKSDMLEGELALLNAAEIIYNVPSNAPVMGACGDDVTWTLGSDGVLTIEGSGAMDDYDSDGAPWMDYADEITSVVVGEGVTSIGTAAFFTAYENLTSVTLPGSLTTIGDHAFSECMALENINLPEGLTSIGYQAFAYDRSLTELTIPASVTSIGELAFVNCMSLTAIDVAAGNTVYSSADGIVYNKTKTELVCCPDGRVTALTVPESVTGIGDYAFACCASLKGVTLPAGLTSVGSGAFEACYALTELTVPAGVMGIAPYTFQLCIALRRIGLPAGVAEIGNSAFYACNALADVYYGGSEEEWAAVEIGENNEPLADAVMHFAQSDGSEIVASGTCGDALTWTLDEDGVLTISGSGAMWDSRPWSEHVGSIREVVIGENVTSIGAFAFLECTALTGIVLPAGVTAIGERAFCECSALKSIVLPESLESIGLHAFGECGALESITLPEGLRTIGTTTFANCSSLTGVTIPASVTNVGERAFIGCSALAGIDVDSENANYSSSDGALYNKAGTELLSCPAGKTGTLVVPDGVTTIREGAFYYCSGLTGITLPEDMSSVESNAFWGCSALTGMTFPENVLSIEEYVFGECSALKSITINGKVTSIGQAAFYGCTALTDVYYRYTEEDWADIIIGDYNEPLLYVALHYNGAVASGQCGDFLTWTLDKNRVLTISGTGDMWDCDWEYVPSAPWSEYADSILTVVLEEGVAGIGNEAFYGCTALRSASLPASLTRIGSGAFEDCYLLKDVVIPANVASIGERAFYGCSALTAITVPDGVTSLPYGVFEGCTALKSVSIPGSVTSLGEAVFAHCTALPSVTIPVSITYIELGAFNGCTGLKNVYYDGNPSQWNAMFIGDFNDELLAAKLHCVLASGVKLFLDGGDVSGKTVFCALPDALGDGSVTVGAVAAPSGADQLFIWTCSDTKGAYGVLTDNGDGTATFTATTGKTGSVTLTAKAADGSGKSAKVTIKIGKLAGDIEITNAPTEMRGGAAVTLKTNLDGDKTLTDRNVEWTLSDDSIPYATLSKNKLTTRKVFEQVTIRVTAAVKARPEISQTIDILLFPETTEARIAYNGELRAKNESIPVQLSKGSVQLVGSTFPTDAMQEGTWKSSNAKLATVDENGVVTLLKAGTATITFTAADGSKKNTAVKLVIGNWVTDITFTGFNAGDGLLLLSGTGAAVKAAITPADATNKKLVWSSSDPTIATVSNGRVTAKTVRREETVTITATAADGSGKSNFFKVNVRPARDTLSLWDEDVDVTGKTLTIPYTEGLNCNTPAVKLYTVADGSFNESVDPADVTWKTSSAKIATVENGEVKFLKAGTVTITAVCGKLSAKLAIKAVIFTDSVSITAPQSNELVSGKSVTLKAAVLPANAANKKLIWQSSDPAAATVSNGKVTAKAVTKRTDVTITATAADGSGAYAEYTFTIVPKATGITIRDNLFRVMNNRSDSISLSARPQLQLSATVFPNGSEGAQQGVTWTSSNKKIAAIDENGNVTLLKKGTVTIKATANDGSKVNASFKIVVTE